MRRILFKSKIHRATVTEANVDYEGSITIDADLMAAADLLPYEKVSVWNVTRGSRIETYAMPGARGSGVVCINGAAAHLNQPGDLVIVASFAELEDAEARTFRPTIVLVDAHNRVRAAGVDEIAGPERRAPSKA
ncbi:MAG TPA: aspartate 1-decarboxylase [Polyangia bacterium]|nr:aspartate 1-decarboxylase [Polyangia bacterium]